MKRLRRLLATFLLVLCSGFASAQLPNGAAAYFVAPTGSDKNPGTIGKPFASLQKANTLLAPGDVVYIRGGTYRMKEKDIARFDGIFAFPVVFDRSGTRERPIRYLAYEDEEPVFDFSDVKPSQLR